MEKHDEVRRLDRATPLGLVSQQPQALCLAFKSPTTIVGVFEERRGISSSRSLERGGK